MSDHPLVVAAAIVFVLVWAYHAYAVWDNWLEGSFWATVGMLMLIVVHAFE